MSPKILSVYKIPPLHNLVKVRIIGGRLEQGKGRMSLLDHLWDETVAGPRPDSGLGKLRKYSSFSPSSSSSSASAATAPGSFQVTRSITILRTATSPRSPLDSASSPACSVPDSPLMRKSIPASRSRSF